MDFLAASDAIKCRAFQIALEGSVRLWYQQLKPRSIDSYQQLRRLFINQFSARQLLKLPPSHLETVKQRDNESLTEYIARLMDEHVKVVSCTDDIAMMYFTTGLNDRNLTIEFGSRPPASLNKMLARARQYIDGLELWKAKGARRSSRGKDRDQRSSPPKKRHSDDQSSSRQAVDDRSRGQCDERGSSDRWGPKFDKFTPLNASVAEIYATVENTDMKALFTAPKKLHRPSGKRDKRLYCRFHKDHGHNSSRCFHLKEQVKDLIRRGYLKKYVGSRERAKPEGSTREEKRERSQPPGRKEDRPAVINTIHGGPSGRKSG
ncbi:uncharacterized protein LOC111017548 [Momordica charantia]|uniref:Uncharacterized protein LOC111017548 n=1 Tax=Momordica charantia TaxID=3673 RepID=A0A6J1D5T3_MOMCH|nr:uncharacterized protein LOC111017548 [Momordica charantia]